MRPRWRALTHWAEALLGQSAVGTGAPTPLALDGKSARGSFDGFEKAVHFLSPVAHESGLAVAQSEVPQGGAEKTNEHKTAVRLLEGLVLEGRLITGDAIFCQRDLSQQIVMPAVITCGPSKKISRHSWPTSRSPSAPGPRRLADSSGGWLELLRGQEEPAHVGAARPSGDRNPR
jgi:hypothetical protein